MKKIKYIIIIALVLVLTGCNKHEHIYTEDVTAPTCTEQGYTIFTCSCKDTYQDSYTSPLNHDYSQYEFKWEEYEKCTLVLTCKNNNEHIETFELEIITEITKEATCTEDGEKTYKVQYTFNEQLYEDSKSVVIEKTGHNYSVWKTVQEGTEEQLWIKEKTCNICSDKLQKTYKCSVGLEYELSDDKTSYVLYGLGECEDTEIIVPHKYKGLPVTKVDGISGESSITKLVIPDSFTEIGAFDFSVCYGLETVVIPTSITIMKEGAFYTTPKLQYIYYDGTKEDWDKITFENYGNPVRNGDHLYVSDPNGEYIEAN